MSFNNDVFNNQKLQLHAKKLDGGDFPPSLKPDFFKGNPSLFMLTGFKKGNGITYIRAGLSIRTALEICETIRKIADMPIVDPEKNIVAIFDCKAGKEKELVSKVTVGKDKSGSMFISVTDAKNSSAPMERFFFRPDYTYHPVIYKNIEEAGDGKAFSSCIAAKRWADLVEQLWIDAFKSYVPEDNKGGGNNNNSNNSYNNNKNSSVDDSDIWDT